MSRKPRYLPYPGATVEITQRTIGGRFLLKPSPRLNALIAGCLARAQKITGAAVHAVAVMSNHLHLLASFETVQQMSRFMCHFTTNVSKELGHLYDWPGPKFAGRYKSVPLSDEPEIHERRLKYLLSQGAKEGLVISPHDWPGVHSAKALTIGQMIHGVWIDRTSLFKARQNDPTASEAEFSSEEAVSLTPLPALAHLTPEQYRVRVSEIVQLIEDETLEGHRLKGTAPLGAEAVCRRHPRDRPKQWTTSSKPYFHATKAAFRNLMDGFREFVAAYRLAAESLAQGATNVTFPENCFPPGLPFVAPGAS